MPTSASTPDVMRFLLSFLIAFSCLAAVHVETKPAISPLDHLNVYVFLHESCVISQYYTLPLRKLHEDYANEQIQFIGLFPNLSSKPEQIQVFKKTYDIPFELKTDHYHTQMDAFGAKVTPEVVVYNETQKEVLYQGRIDDAYARVGQRKRQPTTSELRDVLEALTRGKSLEVTHTQAVGCIIDQHKLN